MYDDVITLISYTTETGSAGDTQKTISKKDVFAQKKSVGMKENYQAFAVGLKPELVFVLADHLDYDGQSELEYNGLIYQVIRTYQTADQDKVELVVSRYGGS